MDRQSEPRLGCCPTRPLFPNSIFEEYCPRPPEAGPHYVDDHCVRLTVAAQNWLGMNSIGIHWRDNGTHIFKLTLTWTLEENEEHSVDITHDVSLGGIQEWWARWYREHS